MSKLQETIDLLKGLGIVTLEGIDDEKIKEIIAINELATILHTLLCPDSHARDSCDFYASPSQAKQYWITEAKKIADTYSLSASEALQHTRDIIQMMSNYPCINLDLLTHISSSIRQKDCALRFLPSEPRSFSEAFFGEEEEQNV